MSTEVESDGETIASVRHELKKWEAAFAAANGGRKPGRDDVKKDATIVAKYEKYNYLTKKAKKVQSTPQKSSKSQQARGDGAPLRERSTNAVSATPRKNSKERKSAQLPEIVEEIEEEPTPAFIRHALGPTPQKDGEILGLFDMLPLATPSRRNATTTAPTEELIGATPTKSTTLSLSEPKPSRTPQSSSKRYYLDAFAGTPLKRKREDDNYTPSTIKRQFATPSFLRRSFPLARIDEDAHESGIGAPPFKKRGLVRSLSTIIQGLKKQEEERMDDDWDVMNEIEAEERGETARPSVPAVLVEDSQAVEMPLGPDQGVESSDDAAEVDPGALDANGQPRKVWKKKGLKRQTRLHKMRPVVQKPRKAADVDATDSEGSELGEVVDTQLQTEAPPEDGENALQDDGSDQDYRHDSQQSVREPAKKGSRKQNKTKATTKKQAADGDKDGNKKTKKVSAQAHANYRTLKIKNKHSKAKGGGRKFGRR